MSRDLKIEIIGHVFNEENTSLNDICILNRKVRYNCFRVSTQMIHLDSHCAYSGIKYLYRRAAGLAHIRTHFINIDKTETIFCFFFLDRDSIDQKKAKMRLQREAIDDIANTIKGK